MLSPAACGIRHHALSEREDSVRLRRSESRYVVRADEFLQAGSVYDLIAAVRPEFLRPRMSDRGLQQSVLPVAYLDGVQLDLAMLRQIPILWVVEIRYLHATAASTRFGRRHEAGAILVTTGRPSP
jgi:hypothetical protein